MLQRDYDLDWCIWVLCKNRQHIFGHIRKNCLVEAGAIHVRETVRPPGFNLIYRLLEIIGMVLAATVVSVYKCTYIDTAMVYPSFLYRKFALKGWRNFVVR